MFFAFLLDVPEGQNARLMSRPMTSLALVIGFYEFPARGQKACYLSGKLHEVRKGWCIEDLAKAARQYARTATAVESRWIRRLLDRVRQCSFRLQ
jgi:hypothetical protein